MIPQQMRRPSPLPRGPFPQGASPEEPPLPAPCLEPIPPPPALSLTLLSGQQGPLPAHDHALQDPQKAHNCPGEPLPHSAHPVTLWVSIMATCFTGNQPITPQVEKGCLVSLVFLPWVPVAFFLMLDDILFITVFVRQGSCLHNKEGESGPHAVVSTVIFKFCATPCPDKLAAFMPCIRFLPKLALCKSSVCFCLKASG